MLSRKRKWSDEDNARLRAHIEAGGSAFRASVMFKRGEAQVRVHANKLGLKFRSIHQLRAPVLLEKLRVSGRAGEWPAGR